ncbi:hypothetical protein FF38_07836 [Lucilia cuprina]|uniref:Uncharacterized protein n=1 Tax=Lucilia cuprina TaxID=7375 RepID=A0A0L0CDM3_LUCCU|nr:UPF0729 protein [Lucilia cuprina]KNC30498.1 hypothetical protein FF38_07836 [Lucilia cuprina]
MVCVPCFIIPVLLYIWHKFIQPIMLRYWNPWAKKDAQGNVIKEAPEFPFECKGGVCPYPGAKKKLKDNESENNTEDKNESEAATLTTKAETVAAATEVESKKDN